MRTEKHPHRRKIPDFISAPRSPIGPDQLGTDWVSEALQTLDARLAAAVDAVKLLFGPDSARDLFRGLHITPTDADRALRRPPVAPLFGPLGFREPLVSTTSAHGRFQQIQEAFDLSSFDLDVLVVALAPEIDTRYERLYGFVQDDVTKKRPTIELALNLLSVSVEQKLEHLRRFASDAPLVRHGLIRVASSDAPGESSRIAHPFTLDESVLRHLLAHPGIDRRIAPFARLVLPPPQTRGGYGDMRAESMACDHGGVFYLCGIDRLHLLDCVCDMAGGRCVLAIDAEAAMASGADWDSLIAVGLRSARLDGHVLLIQGAAKLWGPDHEAQTRHLLRALADHSGAVYLSGDEPWRTSAADDAAAVIPLDMIAVDPAVERRVWSEQITRRGGRTRPAYIAETSATFTLTRAQVTQAVQYAMYLANQRGDVALSREDLFHAARTQTRGALQGLAERFEVEADWDDLVLPDDSISHLQEIALRVSRRETVIQDWGFDRKRAYGKGTVVLFAGPSGTGKTFAAGVLARVIGVDVYRIDLSNVVSKYIGDTEKNLARLFGAAKRSNAILLFDEADALFGKRSQVRDAHDRYANQELAYLLQLSEQFDGLAILTTNMPASMDDAFRRRLAATIHFPLPDEPARRRLWERAWPRDAPLAPDIDVSLLANRLKISGGVIAQAALGAAYLAAEHGPAISLKHVRHALRRELEGLGLAMPDLHSPAAKELVAGARA